MAGGKRRSFRFLPRLRVFPWLVGALGGVTQTMPAGGIANGLAGPSRAFAVACGVIGPVLAWLYLRSPAWRLRVVVDDEALAVLRDGDTRLRLPWAEVRRVIASPATRTCFVDGGAPTKSLLVPGPGAPGPYRIEDREGLYAAILARVPADRVTEVPSLDAPGALAP